MRIVKNLDALSKGFDAVKKTPGGKNAETMRKKRRGAKNIILRQEKA